MQKAEKEQLVHLVGRWRERSNLTINRIVARLQAAGCDISRSMFENRFIRYDQQPDIPPELTLALIAAFSEGLAQRERCTAAEAIELAKLTHLPIDRFEEISRFFPEAEFSAAFSHYAPLEQRFEKKNEPAQKSAAPLPLPLHFPGKTYHRLIGRSRELDQLLAALRDPERKPVVAIVGLGGIGKTTLAQEAMDHCWREGGFDGIVWVSAKTERFIGEGTRKTEVSDYSFEQLLADIGRQCERPDIAKLPPDQQGAAIKQLLLTRRVLVGMDNLETLPDPEIFVDQVCQILGRSKLLITSRHHLRYERIFTLDLGGLNQPEGLAFLREDSAERGIELIAQAKGEELVEIYQATGGAPLAMKLVIGQVSRWPLAQVLDNLKAAKFAGPNYDFYRFIFKQSWDLLTLPAQQVLVSMSVFDLANGSSDLALQQVSRVEPEAIQPALDQLILLSFVDTLGDLGKRRYTLHPLTHYFILSDIVKKWS